MLPALSADVLSEKLQQDINLVYFLDKVISKASVCDKSFQMFHSNLFPGRIKEI